jgi:hypothetical protein
VVGDERWRVLRLHVADQVPLAAQESHSAPLAVTRTGTLSSLTSTSGDPAATTTRSTTPSRTDPYRALGRDELLFVLDRHWNRLGRTLDPDDVIEAAASILVIGN